MPSPPTSPTLAPERCTLSMKKYLLVRWDDYYPSAGLENIRASFHTIEEAEAALNASIAEFYDHSQIIDRDTLDVLRRHDSA